MRLTTPGIPSSSRALEPKASRTTNANSANSPTQPNVTAVDVTI